MMRMKPLFMPLMIVAMMTAFAGLSSAQTLTVQLVTSTGVHVTIPDGGCDNSQSTPVCDQLPPNQIGTANGASWTVGDYILTGVRIRGTVPALISVGGFESTSASGETLTINVGQQGITIPARPHTLQAGYSTGQIDAGSPIGTSFSISFLQGADPANSFPFNSTMGDFLPGTATTLSYGPFTTFNNTPNPPTTSFTTTGQPYSIFSQVKLTLSGSCSGSTPCSVSGLGTTTFVMGDVTVNVRENGAAPPETPPAGYTLELMQGTTADTSTVAGNVGTVLETLLASNVNAGTLIFQSALTPGLLYNMCEVLPGTAPPTVNWSPGTSYFNNGGMQILSCVDFTAQTGTTVMISANNIPQPPFITPSTIKVTEVTYPATNSQIFTFTSNYGSPFNLSTGQSNSASVTPASYPANFSVSETPITGYLTNGTCTVGTTIGISPSSIVLTAAGQQANCTFTNTSLPPVVGPVTGPTLPQPMGTSVPVTAKFTDQFLFTHTCTLAWGDGATTQGSVTEGNASTPGSCSGSHTYTSSAVYSILATVTSPYGSGSASSAPFPVYDPNGSIKGNAKIWSHPFPAVTVAQQKARVSFTAKNDNGNLKGDLEFKLGKFKLKASSYSSVVILSSNLTATITGSGTVKMHTTACSDDCDDDDDRHFAVVTTTYTFQLDAKDGGTNNGLNDAFRFRMWQAGSLVYDSDSTGTGQLSPVIEGKINIKP